MCVFFLEMNGSAIVCDTSGRFKWLLSVVTELWRLAVRELIESTFTKYTGVLFYIILYTYQQIRGAG
jgi:hypothetical protein